jgi:uncharacterized protein
VRQDVEFNAEGTILRGWLFTPEAVPGPYPAVVATHGFGATKESDLERFAEAFAGTGLACLVYDHRNFGDSDGEPRQEIDPWAQVRDYRHAITYLTGLDEVDADRIGIFGTSYSGGHVIPVAAWDKRVKCVYSQVPLLSGGSSSSRFVRSDMVAERRAQFDEDRARRFAGEKPATVPLISGDPDCVTALPNRDGGDLLQKMDPAQLGRWKNEVTLRSVEMFWEYEPGLLIDKVSPAPLMMVVMAGDVLAHADIAFRTYARALEPKRLVSLSGGHFDVYDAHLETAVEYSTAFFAEHLIPTAVVPAEA